MLRQGKDFSDDWILSLFLFLPKILLGLFVLLSLCCVLWGLFAHVLAPRSLPRSPPCP